MAAYLMKARFVEPMLLLPTARLPERSQLAFELKLDGFRAQAIKSGGTVHLRSRNHKDFNSRYPEIVKALAGMPDETVIDGEIVALDEPGRPSFNSLQNVVPGVRVVFYAFDVMIAEGRDMMTDGARLVYTGRTRNGFTPSTRDQLSKRFDTLATEKCPFANLPERRSGRWGEGLTAEKMRECRWLRPALVGQFEFVEWTPDGHLRHARFAGLRENQEPNEVAVASAAGRIARGRRSGQR
jgi:ATP-dependent DNA ligase